MMDLDFKTTLDLDPFNPKKMDLDFWSCFGGENPVL